MNASPKPNEVIVAEMAVYIGLSAISAPPGAPKMRTEDAILLLSSDGFTASEINEHLDRAMSLALSA